MASQLRLYLDEDAQQASLVRALRARQVDVLTAQEAGTIGLSDARQLARAVEEGRAIFTFNRGDFVQLHMEYTATGRRHAGIIVSDQLPVGLLLRRLMKLVDGLTPEDMENRLEFLSTWR
jgi:hypothetical protein